jgi:methionyl-tRNA formyltransferase
MRVMIVGQRWMGEQALRLCLARDLDVAAVSAPRLDDQLAAAAADAGIPLCQVDRCLEAHWVPDGVDVILCAHAHVFVTPGARAKARLGALGYHPSLLPRHRGRDAVRWTILMGDKVAGGTVYWLDDGADTGHIAAQDWCWVRKDDTPESLWRRDLGPLGVRLFGEVIDVLRAGETPRTPQQAEHATWEPAFAPSKLARVSASMQRM